MLGVSIPSSAPPELLRPFLEPLSDFLKLTRLVLLDKCFQLLLELWNNETSV